MPVPAFNLYPPFSIVRVSHTELVVRDLATSRAFYDDTLGLQVTFEDSRMICLRAMEERGHHCLILRKGDDPVSRYLAFRVFSDCLLYTSPSPRDATLSRMPSSA